MAMSTRTQVIIMAAIIISILMVLVMVKRRMISLKYAMPWVIAAVGVAVFTCFPILTQRISDFFGVEIPSNMIFFLGFCFSLFILFTLSLAVSRLSKKMKCLVQHQALMQKEIDDLKNILEERV